MSLHISAIISQLFKVITLAKCVLTILELNWNQHFRGKKTKLNICHHAHIIHTSAKQVISCRGMNEHIYKLFKNEKSRCKTIVFHGKLCKFVMFLLPSSWWSLKLPIMIIGSFLKQMSLILMTRYLNVHPANQMMFMYDVTKGKTLALNC